MNVIVRPNTALIPYFHCYEIPLLTKYFPMISKHSFFYKKVDIRGQLLCLPPSITEEVYCFSRRQLIFSLDRRVIYHLKSI